MASILISSIEGNRQKLDGGAMFGNAPRAVWSRWLTPDELGRIELACRCLLIEIDDTRILCETGIGAFMDTKSAERYGVQNSQQHLLLENLQQQLGLSSSDIDWIILSHLHFDHAGGLLSAFSENQKTYELAFPKAKIAVGKQAYERAKKPHPRDRASFIPDLIPLLENSKRLVVFEEKKIPGFLEKYISFYESIGHTPGQSHLILQSGKNLKNKLFFAGDLIPGAPWVHIPITMGYDRFAEKVIDEKQEVYTNLLGENDWIFFTHDPKWAAGQLKKTSLPQGDKFEPRNLEASFLRKPF